MDKFLRKFKNNNNFSFDNIMRIILFLIPLIGITFKSIIFQGFVINQDPYSLDILAGYNSAKPFIIMLLHWSLLVFLYYLKERDEYYIYL